MRLKFGARNTHSSQRLVGKTRPIPGEYRIETCLEITHAECDA